MSREMFGFCGEAGTAAECTLYLSVLGYEPTDFRVAVFGLSDDTPVLCAEGCGWAQLGE